MQKLFSLITNSKIKTISISAIFFVFGIFFYLAVANIPLLIKADHILVEKFSQVIPYDSSLGVVIKDVSVLGNVYYAFFAFNVLIVLTLLFYKEYRDIPLVILANSSILFSYFMKNLFGRERPFGIDYFDPIPGFSTGLSYPSTHTVYYTAFWGVIIYLTFKFKKLPKIGAKLLQMLGVYFVLFVGISRVYLKAHWPSDVIGGYLFGFAFLFILILVDKYYLTENQKS